LLLFLLMGEATGFVLWALEGVVFVGCVPSSSSLPSLSTNRRFRFSAEIVSAFFGDAPTSLVPPRDFASRIDGNLVLTVAGVRLGGGGVISSLAEGESFASDPILRALERVPIAMS
jgi:hypothetical protein